MHVVAVCRLSSSLFRNRLHNLFLQVANNSSVTVCFLFWGVASARRLVGVDELVDSICLNSVP